MKKLLAIVLCMVCVMGLAACGNSEGKNDAGTKTEENKTNDTNSTNETKNADETKQPEEEVKDLNLEEVYQAIMKLQADKGLEAPVMFSESNPDLINGLYVGLGDIELKQEVIYMPPVTGAAHEIALVEVAKSEDIDKVKDVFKARIDMSSEGGCDPETGEIWKSRAQIQTAGNYVAMIVLPSEYEIPENVFLMK